MYRALVARLREAAPFDEDSRRAVTMRVCGVESTRCADRPGMTRLIREMRRLCREHHVGLPRLKRDPRRPLAGTTTTKKQVAWAAELARRLGWDTAPERMVGFVRRVTRGFRGRVEELSRKEMSVLITAMLAELRDQARGAAKRDRPDHVAHSATPQRPQWRVLRGGLLP